MMDYEDIVAAMSGKIGSKYVKKKEFKELPNILQEDEMPLHCVWGTYMDSVGNGILLATDRRLIFIDKGLMSLKVEDFPYSRITSVQYKTGWASGEIVIHASGNKAKISNVLKDECTLFADWLRNHIDEYHMGSKPRQYIAPQNLPSAQSTVVASKEERTDKVIKQLKELGELKNQGILTEEEFQQQKAKILNP
jgi:hypothetical protein